MRKDSNSSKCEMDWVIKMGMWEVLIVLSQVVAEVQADWGMLVLCNWMLQIKQVG